MHRLGWVPGILCFSVFWGCGGDDERTVAGGSQAIFGGTVSTWATLDSDDKVIEVGTTIPLATVENAGTQTGRPRFELDFPSEIQTSLCCFDHVSLYWQSVGHGGAYTKPHFDIDFYGIDHVAEMAITCGNQPMPAAERLPTNYFIRSTAQGPVGNCVPAKGLLALDRTAPEQNPTVNPDIFTQTWALGYDNGQFIFFESMLARDFLLRKQSFTMNMPRPAVLGRSTLWPSSFRAEYDAQANEYRLIASGFTPIQ